MSGGSFGSGSPVVARPVTARQTRPVYRWEAPLFICFSKKDSRSAYYAAAFDQGMIAIKDDGSYETLLGRYSFLSAK